MNVRNKIFFFLFFLVAISLFAQTPQPKLERLQQNYIQSLVSNDDETTSLVELPSGIQPETEIADLIFGYGFHEKPVCKNRWYNEVGIFKTLDPISLLMKNELDTKGKAATIDRWCDFMDSFAPATVEGEIIDLHIEHGKANNVDQIFSNSSAEKAKAFSTQDIEVIRNDQAVQAVGLGGCFYVTAYELQKPDLQHDPRGKCIPIHPFIRAPFVKGIKIDGKSDDWNIPSAVCGLIAPWNGAVKDSTAFYVCHDEKHLYFLYKVSDTTLIYNSEKTEASIGNSDRIEFFLSKDSEMKTYYCAEIDPQGKVMDYEAHHYRKFDGSWNFNDLRVATYIGKDSYCVEGSLSLKSLKDLGIVSPKGEIRMGVYRADYFGNKDDQVIWYSWIIPESTEPDFHIPSSLSILRLE